MKAAVGYEEAYFQSTSFKHIEALRRHRRSKWDFTVWPQLRETCAVYYSIKETLWKAILFGWIHPGSRVSKKSPQHCWRQWMTQAGDNNWTMFRLGSFRRYTSTSQRTSEPSLNHTRDFGTPIMHFLLTSQHKASLVTLSTRLSEC